jgi:hypothetical protein
MTTCDSCRASGLTRLSRAEVIRDTERGRALRVREGEDLCEQFRFRDYLAKHATPPAYSFRDHLRAIGGAVEE